MYMYHKGRVVHANNVYMLLMNLLLALRTVQGYNFNSINLL